MLPAHAALTATPTGSGPPAHNAGKKHAKSSDSAHANDGSCVVSVGGFEGAAQPEGLRAGQGPGFWVSRSPLETALPFDGPCGRFAQVEGLLRILTQGHWPLLWRRTSCQQPSPSLYDAALLRSRCAVARAHENERTRTRVGPRSCVQSSRPGSPTPTPYESWSAAPAEMHMEGYSGGPSGSCKTTVELRR